MANKDGLRWKHNWPTIVIHSYCCILTLWGGGCVNTLPASGSLLLKLFHPSGIFHLMDISAGTRPEVMEHGQQRWVEVEA